MHFIYATLGDPPTRDNIIFYDFFAMRYASFLLVGLLLCLACRDESSSTQKALNDKKKGDVVIKEKALSLKNWREEDPYRNENWQPEKGKYFFSELWTFDYYNELLAVDDVKAKGAFSIFLDPFSGTILLDRNNTKYGDEMTEWILVEPDGRYQFGTVDEHGKKQVSQLKVKLKDEDNEAFQKYFRPQNQQKSFGKTSYDPVELVGEQYLMTFQKTSETSTVYLAQVPFNTYPFYFLNQVRQELFLPVDLDYSSVLPSDFLVVSERYERDGKAVGFVLKSIGGASYFLDVEAYKK